VPQVPLTGPGKVEVEKQEKMTRVNHQVSRIPGEITYCRLIGLRKE